MVLRLYDRAALRTDLLAALIEGIGTIVFILLGLGGIQASISSNAASLAAAEADTPGSAASANVVASVEQLLYIATSMGLALLISCWVFYRASGSVFNPNVGLALVLTGVLTPQRFALYCVAQFGGAIAACGILQGILPGPLAVTPSLGAGTNRAQGVWIEAFLTAILCLTVLMLAAEKSAVTPFAPVGIGLALFSCHLLGVVFTGAGMNTARSFAPAVVSVVSGFSNEQWIYWLGPTIGAGLAVIVFALLKAVHYQEGSRITVPYLENVTDPQLNPGQDSAHAKDSPDFLEKVLSAEPTADASTDATPSQMESGAVHSDTTIPPHSSLALYPAQPLPPAIPHKRE